MQILNRPKRAERGNFMEITIFAKKRQSNDGRTFYTYLTNLVKKSTGESVTVQVKFRQDCGNPDPHACPCNIEVDKSKCNYREKTIEQDGKTIVSRVMWVSEWENGSEYVDDSMNDF